MVQLGFRGGVTSRLFRCMCSCCVIVYMWFSQWYVEVYRCSCGSVAACSGMALGDSALV